MEEYREWLLETARKVRRIKPDTEWEKQELKDLGLWHERGFDFYKRRVAYRKSFVEALLTLPATLEINQAIADIQSGRDEEAAQHLIAAASVKTDNIQAAPADEVDPANRLSAEARALAVAVENPDLTSLAAIAKRAGCTPQALSKKKAPVFRAALAVRLDAQKSKSAPRRGSKTDGIIEAIDETDPTEEI
jgi:hypothetical protein